MVDTVLAVRGDPLRAIYHSNWPDSGLTRNTRALGYRCSVPGLAGFTGAALCGARSLITCQNISDCRFPVANLLSRRIASLSSKIRTPSGLISEPIGNRHLAIGNKSNRRLAVRDHPQQPV